jgi:hypothetical protein
VVVWLENVGGFELLRVTLAVRDPSVASSSRDKPAAAKGPDSPYSAECIVLAGANARETSGLNECSSIF